MPLNPSVFLDITIKTCARITILDKSDIIVFLKKKPLEHWKNGGNNQLPNGKNICKTYIG